MHKKGYVMRHSRGHPRAKSTCYVFDHILVMERFIERYLEPGETVHHVNGVKDDNRLENLELWCKPQPSGIRACDALAWARMIVARYEKLPVQLQQPLDIPG